MKTIDEIQKSKSGKHARRKGLDNEKRLLEKLRVFFPDAQLGPPSGAKGGDFEGTGRVQFEAKKMVSLPSSPEKALAQAEKDARGYSGVDVGAVILSDTAAPGARVNDRVYLKLEEFLELASGGVPAVLVGPGPHERAPLPIDWNEESVEFVRKLVTENAKKTIYGDAAGRLFKVDIVVSQQVLERLGEAAGLSAEQIEDALEKPKGKLA